MPNLKKRGTAGVGPRLTFFTPFPLPISCPSGSSNREQVGGGNREVGYFAGPGTISDNYVKDDSSLIKMIYVERA